MEDDTFMGNSLRKTLDIKLFNGKNTGQMEELYVDDMSLIVKIDKDTDLAKEHIDWKILTTKQERILDAIRVLQKEIFAGNDADDEFITYMWDLLKTMPTYEMVVQRMFQIVENESEGYVRNMWKTLLALSRI